MFKAYVCRYKVGTGTKSEPDVNSNTKRKEYKFAKCSRNVIYNMWPNACFSTETVFKSVNQ